MKYFFSFLGETPIVLHVPHSSVTIPADCRPDFLLDDHALFREAEWMADRFTDELFPARSPYSIVRSDISRLVVDMERYSNDRDEPMSAYGMDAVYTKTSLGDPLKNITNDRRTWYMDRFYHPYHQAFADLVNRVARQFGYCCIIDCHSFPSVPRYYEDQTPNRPDICLGTNPTTPKSLVEHVRDSFSTHGYSVEENRPFSGAILPGRAYMAFPYERNVFSVMIEVNRRLYMDENSGEKCETFSSIQTLVDQTIRGVANVCLKQGLVLSFLLFLFFR